MLYMVEIECMSLAFKVAKCKKIIYTENPNAAKKELYNLYSSVFKNAVIFKTFREATKEETTKYVMDDGDYFINITIPAHTSYIDICDIY